MTFEANDDPDINSVWLWYEFQIALTGAEHQRILRVLRPGASIPGEALDSHELQFIGLTRTEVRQFFDDQRARLELLTMFELLAATEAFLWAEFNARVAARKKDPLSRRFRTSHEAYGEKMRLEDILNALKEEGIAAHVVSDFKGTLTSRHWLAHGKRWPPMLGRNYTPNDIFDAVRELIDSIPL
jgi:hypothetical protein